MLSIIASLLIIYQLAHYHRDNLNKMNYDFRNILKIESVHLQELFFRENKFYDNY